MQRRGAVALAVLFVFAVTHAIPPPSFAADFLSDPTQVNVPVKEVSAQEDGTPQAAPHENLSNEDSPLRAATSEEESQSDISVGNPLSPIPFDYSFQYGQAGDRPLVGDWNGDGLDDAGFQRGNRFYLDANGNGILDPDAGDRVHPFGIAGDIALVGDWNGDGTDDIGVYRGNRFYLDLNGDGAWNTGDIQRVFGNAGDTAVVGDWNGDGRTDIGVQRGNVFYLDANGDGAWNAGDIRRVFGNAGDTAVIGDWNGDGLADLGVRRRNQFFLDANGNGRWDGVGGGMDSLYAFGSEGDKPLAGDWDGDGKDGIGVHRGDRFFLDGKENGRWDPSLETKIRTFYAAVQNSTEAGGIRELLREVFDLDLSTASGISPRVMARVLNEVLLYDRAGTLLDPAESAAFYETVFLLLNKIDRNDKISLHEILKEEFQVNLEDGLQLSDLKALTASGLAFDDLGKLKAPDEIFDALFALLRQKTTSEIDEIMADVDSCITSNWAWPCRMNPRDDIIWNADGTLQSVNFWSEKPTIVYVLIYRKPTTDYREYAEIEKRIYEDVPLPDYPLSFQYLKLCYQIQADRTAADIYANDDPQVRLSVEAFTHHIRWTYHPDGSVATYQFFNNEGVPRQPSRYVERSYGSESRLLHTIEEKGEKDQREASEEVYFENGLITRRIYRELNHDGTLARIVKTAYHSPRRPKQIEQFFYEEGLRKRRVAQIFDLSGRLIKNESQTFDTSGSEVNVTDFGAVGDGTTDDSIAFQAAQAVARRGGGIIRVPPTPQGYVIGKGTGTEGFSTGIRVASNTQWIGEGTKLIHRAFSNQGGVFLFHVENVKDILIKGFIFDGEEGRHNSIGMQGVIQNVTLEDLHLYDHIGYAIVYGDESQDPAKARFENLTFRRVRITGKTGPDGVGSGINIYSRSQWDENTPSSKGLYFYDMEIDITQGETDVTKHGPQAIKINNVDGLVIRNARLRGGSITALSIGNSVLNAVIEDVQTFLARRGLYIGTLSNRVTVRTSNIQVKNFSYRKEGAASFFPRGVDIQGFPENVTLENINVEGGHIAINDIGRELEFELKDIEDPYDDFNYLIEKKMAIYGKTSQSYGIIRALQGRRMITWPYGTEWKFQFIPGEIIDDTYIYSPVPKATIVSVVDRNALDGIQFRNVVIRDGNFMADNPAEPWAPLKRVLVDGLTFLGTNPNLGRIVSAVNRPFQNSEFLYVQSYQSSSDLVRGPFDDSNRLVVGPRPFVSGQASARPPVPLYSSAASRRTLKSETPKKKKPSRSI